MKSIHISSTSNCLSVMWVLSRCCLFSTILFFVGLMNAMTLSTTYATSTTSYIKPATQTLTSQLCGNGEKEGTEQCDDGNTDNGDGCSSTCQIENLCMVNKVTCKASDPCHYGVCQPRTGTCIYYTATDGTSCDDGNLCSLTSACKQGVCMGTSFKNVQCGDPPGPGYVAACDPATGQCQYILLPRPKSCGDSICDTITENPNNCPEDCH